MFQCLATIASVYWRSNEESVEGDRPQKAPVLESRETAYASNSRADRVQGTYPNEIAEKASKYFLFLKFFTASGSISNLYHQTQVIVTISLSLYVINWTTCFMRQ